MYLATPNQSLQDALQVLARKDVNQLPVVQQGRLVGIVNREAVVNFLEVRQSLGLLGDKQKAAVARSEPPPMQHQEFSAPPGSDRPADRHRAEREQAEWQDLVSRK